MEKKARIVWVDLLRVIGVIGVILIHVVSNTINTFGGLSPTSHIFYCFITFIIHDCCFENLSNKSVNHISIFTKSEKINKNKSNCLLYEQNSS